MHMGISVLKTGQNWRLQNRRPQNQRSGRTSAGNVIPGEAATACFLRYLTAANASCVHNIPHPPSVFTLHVSPCYARAPPRWSCR